MMIIDKIKAGLDAMDEPYKEVTIAKEERAGEAYFVVCDITYPDQTMTVPFVVYEGEGPEGVFMPKDWTGALPGSADEIESPDWEWVTMPGARQAVMMDGLPRLLAGDF